MSKREYIRQLSDYIFNPISLIGLGFIIFTIAMIAALQLIQTIAGTSVPYGGMVAFVVLPPLFILGLILVPIGIWRQRKRMAQAGELEDKFFKLDFAIPSHRWYFQGFVVLSFIVLMVTVTLSYHAFHYTESVEFCSSCHAVMEPEATTHQLSPHARVKCVECHVGPGAEWYVRSKLSGLYQVYATLANKYPRPIETPITNLRPARDTCEQCHWPQFFIDDKVVRRDYFLPDDENTPGHITLQMHVGGHPEYGRPSGIHWHVLNKVYFVANDKHEEEIPWVKVVREDGSEHIYQSTEDPLSEEELKTRDVHLMDCIDCHNRPSHIYRSPREIMNRLLASGLASKDLPGIRGLGSELLQGDYESVAEAEKAIAQGIRDYYKGQDVPDEAVSQAVGAIQKAYRQNFFPFMKTRWDVHPSHIGHMRTLGCFRCHGGSHADADGKVIPRDCDLCHTILAQQNGDQPERFDIKGIPFEHPEDIGGEWETTNCNECHTGI